MYKLVPLFNDAQKWELEIWQNLYTKLLSYETPTDNQASLCHFDVYDAA